MQIEFKHSFLKALSNQMRHKPTASNLDGLAVLCVEHHIQSVIAWRWVEQLITEGYLNFYRVIDGKKHYSLTLKSMWWLYLFDTDNIRYGDSFQKGH